MATASTATTSTTPQVTIRIRLLVADATVMGPGKLELLGHIRDSGSIAEAAKCMGMSYNRAWLHVKIMNDFFKEPLVESVRGGATRGGATLTATGEKVMAAYQEMVAEAEAATLKAQRKLLRLLKE